MLEHAIKFDESCETARSAGEIILPTPKLNIAKNIMNDTKIFVFAENERKFCFTFLISYFRAFFDVRFPAIVFNCNRNLNILFELILTGKAFTYI